MATLSFSRFLYCDTNILSHLAKHQELRAGWARHLLERDLTLAVGSQVAELADASSLHASLVRLLTSVPSGLIKTWDQILDEEVQAHPSSRTATLLMYPLNALLLEEGGLERFREFLSSAGLAEARSGQRAASLELPERLATLKPNFPPGSAGKYTRQQAAEFAWMQALQWLAPGHRDFLERFLTDAGKFNASTFRSVRLYALVLYHKYYLGNREPRRPSDFGDLAHLYAIPYCCAAIMERDLANTLIQIKRHDGVLDHTEIYNLDVVSKWANAAG